MYPGIMLMIRPPCRMVFTALSKSGPSTSPENIQVRMSADIGADHLRTEIAHLHIFHKMRRTRKLWKKPNEIHCLWFSRIGIIWSPGSIWRQWKIPDMISCMHLFTPSGTFSLTGQSCSDSILIGGKGSVYCKDPEELTSYQAAPVQNVINATLTDRG